MSNGLSAHEIPGPPTCDHRASQPPGGAFSRSVARTNQSASIAPSTTSAGWSSSLVSKRFIAGIEYGAGSARSATVFGTPLTFSNCSANASRVPMWFASRRHARTYGQAAAAVQTVSTNATANAADGCRHRASSAITPIHSTATGNAKNLPYSAGLPAAKTAKTMPVRSPAASSGASVRRRARSTPASTSQPISPAPTAIHPPAAPMSDAAFADRRASRGCHTSPTCCRRLK